VLEGKGNTISRVQLLVNFELLNQLMFYLVFCMYTIGHHHSLLGIEIQRYRSKVKLIGYGYQGW